MFEPLVIHHWRPPWFVNLGQETMGGADVVIVLLQCYFMLMNLTVERTYCHAPIKRGDTGFLVPETVDVRARTSSLAPRRGRLALPIELLDREIVSEAARSASSVTRLRRV
jgi:hypothetical protein